MVKLGVRIRLRIVIEDCGAKYRARRTMKYWEWVSSRRSYIVAPRYPYRYYEISIMEKYLT